MLFWVLWRKIKQSKGIERKSTILKNAQDQDFFLKNLYLCRDRRKKIKEHSDVCLRSDKHDEKEVCIQ